MSLYMIPICLLFYIQNHIKYHEQGEKVHKHFGEIEKIIERLIISQI